MAEMKPKPIIIKKKVAGHGGHHGGAWKVAYADFVTAMMALFIVLWLMNSNVKVQDAVAGYFRDPTGEGKLTGTDKAGQGKGGSVVVVKKDDMPRLQHEIEKALKSLPDFQKIKDQVSMTVTSEGLRIELLETETGMFFESGSAEPTSAGTGLLRSLAGELGKLPNRVLIEGHTDARPYMGTRNYSNWELSTDRANKARTVMQANGLKPTQVHQVRGFADQSLRDREHPNDASNRRVTLLVPYLEATEKDAEEGAGKAAPGNAEGSPKAAEPPKKEEPPKAAGH